MNKQLKSVLLLSGAFIAYRFIKLYELGENVIYKPVGVSFQRGKSINDFVVRVKMELLNPTNAQVLMKGIDGKLMVKGQTIGTFVSPQFVIKGGLNYFFLDFKVNPSTIGVTLIQSIINKKVPVFVVELTKRLQLFSMKETFAINPNTVATETNVMVK